MFALPDGYEVLLGTGGSTAFWDAAAFGIVEQRAEHLVFGEFSSKFAQVTRDAPFLDDPVVIESPPGTHPELVADASVDAYAFPHNETSTGVMIDVRRPADTGGLVVVDGTSGAAGLRVDPTQFDVYYFAPQKAFAADGGIWVALCSPAAIERIEQTRYVRTLGPTVAQPADRARELASRPDLQHAAAGVDLPAGTHRALDARPGRPGVVRRLAATRSAEIVYGWAEASAHAMPYVAKPSERSHTIGTIDFVDTIDAAAVAATLRANGIVDTEPYRKLGRNQLRIALFPAIEPDDLAALTRCIDFVIDTL